MIARAIGDIHAQIVFDKILTAVPVTLPKKPVKPLKIRRPRLKRKPRYTGKIKNTTFTTEYSSLLNIPAEAEKQKDTADRLADHMSEYETTRFGEVLGVS